MQTTKPKPKDKKVKVFMVLTESQINRLEAVAERLTTSRSQLVRQACEEFLAKAHGEVVAN